MQLYMMMPPANTIRWGISTPTILLPPLLLLLTTIIMMMSVMMAPHLADSLTFTSRCQATGFTTFHDAQALCDLTNEFLGSPRWNTDFTAVSALGTPDLIVNAVSNVSFEWRWMFGPFTGEVLYAGGHGSLIENSNPWRSGTSTSTSATSGNHQIAYSTATGWQTKTSITSIKCALCQSMPCSELCNVTGTASYTPDLLATSWKQCVCTCKPGYRGKQCQYQTSVHCDTSRTTSMPATEAMSYCAAKGGFLATPHQKYLFRQIQKQYLPEAEIDGYFWHTLIGGNDEATSQKWIWTDGPLAGLQLWQGLSGGSPRNGFPTGLWTSGEPNHWTGGGGTENQLVINHYTMSDCALNTCGFRCYACQYTGCDATRNPCMTDNTLSMSGSDFSNCTCNCKIGYGGRFCECLVGSCDPRGGAMTSTIDSVFGSQCKCTCKPNYGGVNCDERTNTPTISISISPSRHLSLSNTSTYSSVRTNTATIPKTATQHSPAITQANLLVPSHQASCPTMVITIAIVRNGTSTEVPTGGLTDGMIRRGGVTVGVSLSPLVDAIVEFASPSVFTFGVESLGVSDPRSYPSVVNLNDIRCAFHADTRRTVLCELPASPDYTIRDAENLRITATASSMLNVGPCGSSATVVVGSIAVSPATADKLTASLQAAFAVATAVSTVVISLLGDGSPIETQVLVMILDSPCAATYDRKSVAWVRYIVMPGAALGPSWTMGVNVMVAVGVFVAHIIIMLVVCKFKKDTATSQQVRTSLMFPGISVSVAQVMYAGVMYGTMGILRMESGAAGAAAIVGLVYMVLVPAVVLYLLAFEANVLYYPYDWKVEGVSKGRRWLYPHGFWSPRAQMFRLFSVVGPYRMGMHYAALSPFLLGLTVAILMAALPTVVMCDYLYVSVGVAGIVLGLATLVGNPMRSQLQSYITALCLTLLGLLAILQIVAIRSNSETIVIAKGVCNYVLIALLALRAFHSIFIFVFEFRSKDELIANMRDRGDSIITEEEEAGIGAKPSAFDDDDITTGGTTPHILSPTARKRHANTDGGGVYILGSGRESSCSSRSHTSSVADISSPKSEDVVYSAPLERGDLLLTSWNGNSAGASSFNNNNGSPQSRGAGGTLKGDFAMSGSSSVPVSGPSHPIRNGSVVSSSPSLGTSFNIRTTAFNTSIVHTGITSPIASPVGLVPVEIPVDSGGSHDYHTPKGDAGTSSVVSDGQEWSAGNNSDIGNGGGLLSSFHFLASQPFTSPFGSFNHNHFAASPEGSGSRSPQLLPGTTPTAAFINAPPTTTTLSLYPQSEEEFDEYEHHHQESSLRNRSITRVGGGDSGMMNMRRDADDHDNNYSNMDSSVAMHGGEGESPPSCRTILPQGTMMSQVFGGGSATCSITSPIEECLSTSPVQLAFDFN